MALLRFLVLVAGAFSKQVTPQQTPTVGPLTTVSLKFESLQGGLGLAQWTWKRRRMTLETTTALVLSVVWWWRLGTAEITGRSAPFPLSSLKSLAHPLVLYFFSFVRSTKLATRFPTRHHTLKMASAGRGCDKTVFFDHPTPRFAPLEIPSGGTSRWKFQRDVTSRWEFLAGESPAGNFQRDVELSSDPAGNSQRVEVPLGIPSGT